ncbi:MAG: GWxTD domain-containing protein [Clostridiales bacterium]|nr:GWxTD domain-containing protein [Clostridiales bacterium]
MKREFWSLLIFPVIFFLPVHSTAESLKEKDLPSKHQEWLKLTNYIILQKEKEVFLQLTTDRDRDIFIESFWKQRDPTPGTPQNEFKEEHIKRFNYANTYFGRDTPREGWQTDMGRMHIILGPPASIERFDSVAGLYPAQVWYYYGDRSKGLPTYFAIVFFKRSGAGEFKIYNPTSDGPLSLIIDARGIDITDYRAQYEKIKELAPTLAGVAISMIPGEYPYNFQPSPQTNIILADIFESPKKNISPSYATHFLDYKGIVSTEYLTNFVESSAVTAVAKEPMLGMSLCHFSVVPKKISLDYFGPRDQYYCNFKLDVSLRQGEKIIYQYTKDFPFYFEPDRLAAVEANGIALQDVFPVVEGRYELTVLLQNSVGKEFTVYEKIINVPEASGPPKILCPVLGYSVQNLPSEVQTPFKLMNDQFQVVPENMFTLKDRPAMFISLLDLTEEVWREGTVEILVNGLKDKNPVRKSLFIKTRDFPFNKAMGISWELPIGELNPDYYELKLILRGSQGEPISEASSSFIVSPQTALSRPVTLSKSISFEILFFYYYILAEQYDRIDETGKAEANFEKALALNPGFKPGIVAYAKFLLKTGKFDRALETIERVSGDESLEFDYFLVTGRALEGKGEYRAAIERLLEGNKIYNSDTCLLNSLGFCYYKTGQKKAALDVLNASLRLNPEQSEIRELLARIEKELK